MMRTESFDRLLGGISAARVGMQLDLEIAVACSPMPPIRDLEIRSQFTPVSLATEPVAEEKRKPDVSGKSRSVRSARLETAEVLVAIVEKCEIERELMMWLDAVAKLIGHQDLGLKLWVPVESRHCRRGTEE